MFVFLHQTTWTVSGQACSVEHQHFM